MTLPAGGNPPDTFAAAIPMTLLLLSFFPVEILEDRFYNEVVDRAVASLAQTHQAIHRLLLFRLLWNVDGEGRSNLLLSHAIHPLITK